MTLPAVAVSPEDMWFLLVAGIRYSMGRQTYAPSAMQGMVRMYATALTTLQLKQIGDEVAEELRRDRVLRHMGADFDMEGWREFRDWCYALVAERSGG